MAGEAPLLDSSTTCSFPSLSTSTGPISTAHTINIGTRKSNLALIQADLVVALLKEKWPQHNYVIHGISTMGDKNQVSALHDFGAKSLWTFELEHMLEERTVDFIVHCLKDMPTQLPSQCDLGPILPREDPRDALIFAPRFTSDKGKVPTLASLPHGAVIGTSSVRRSAQLKRIYPRLKFESIRGNLETRLRKLDAEDSPFSAIVLAAAGMIRIGQSHRLNAFLESKNPEGVSTHGGHEHTESSIQLPAMEVPDEAKDGGEGAHEIEKRQGKIGDHRWGMLYAVGQGALAIEMRKSDERVLELLEPLKCETTSLACLSERSLMRTLEGGCSVPIGVETEWKDQEARELIMRAIVVSLDGTEAAEAELTKVVKTDNDADLFGQEIAGLLRQRGADKILDSINANR